MRIYTRTGDDGETGLYGGQRVHKDDVRIEAYGTVDELNAALGIVRTTADIPADLDQLLAATQNELFAVGAELATPDPAEQGTRFVCENTIRNIERTIDVFEAELSPLTRFILPAGTFSAASLHLSRCVCRRAERRVVSLMRQDERVSPSIIEYLNRLGDLLFVLARVANARQSVSDRPWSRPE
jgi:cob(I)alamin adenosyltransferase